VSRALATFLAALVLVCLNTACSRDEAAGRDTASQTRDSKSTPSAPPAAAAQQTHAGMNMPEHGTANLRTPNPTDPGSRPSTGSGRPEALEGRIPDPGREISLSPDMISRAGIKTAAATKGTAASRLHLPGVVQPNAYKNVDVTSLVAGRMQQVRVELGQRVMQNEVLATVYSPELADAQTTFISAKAQREAHGLALTRTQRLYAIGAASREELEKMTAEASEMDRALETARARLALLGIPEDRAQRLASPADVVTTFEVKAPFAGIITKRSANVGLNIEPSTPLFTVTDLSTVWIVADLYERDFATVGVGSAVSITATAYPGLELRGRVQYIDPQVEPETRTAKLRAEVPNAGDRLRFGMFVDVSIASRTSRPVVMVPKGALQIVGTQAVVYVTTGPGRFVQRAVTVSDTMGNDIAVSSGLNVGDEVVTEGAFFLRAESDRLGVR
jgi:cobalt-zinc-cadmium efflux system membrane fusion protein